MKKIVLVLVILLSVAGIVYLTVRFIPSGQIPEGDLEISEVDLGSVIRTIEGEGNVEPESEVLILSPASSIIQRIVKDVGSRVELGEAIIILDPTPIQMQIEKIEDQLEVKRNSLRKNRLNARSIKLDLDYNVEVKNLKIASLKSELADQEQLLEVGGISPANYEKTKQELVLAEKDLETLKTRNRIRLQQIQTEETGLQLQIEIQEKELEHQMELLKRMIVRAPSSGIILSLDGKQGEKVSKDHQLITMSNLSQFKIRATTDASNSEYIETGNQVMVSLAEELLKGQIGTISPAIKDRKVEFDVYLERSDHWKLRPNLSLPLKVVTQRADSVLRVRYAPSLDRSGSFDIYLVDGDIARKQRIETGLHGDDYLEIKSGLQFGDRVIVSDVTFFRNRDEVEIN